MQSNTVLNQSLHCRSHRRTLDQIIKIPNRILYTYQSDSERVVLTLKSCSSSNSSHRSNISNSPTMATVQTRAHSGHSHSHHDNTYLTSTNKKDPGVRITRVGLYVNFGMVVSKGIGGYVFHSQALVADAFHALTDMVSDIMTLLSVSKANKLPTTQYPSGYGKVESLGSLGVSGLLCLGGIAMCWNSAGVLYAQFFAEVAAAASHSHGIFGHSHDHSAAHMIPNLNAAWLAGGSIIVKEWLYRSSMCSSLRLFMVCTDLDYL